VTVRRLPIVVVLVVLLVVSYLVEPRLGPGGVGGDVGAAAALGPLATTDDAGTSTWFCAGGSARRDGPARHVVTVANPTERPAAGSMRVFVEGGATAEVPISVKAHDQVRVALADVVDGDWAAALVEVDAGGVVVTHEVTGPGGWDADRCSSQASPSWYLPWGQTAPQEQATMRLALFNPFPVEAVVDITFDTDDGFRAPEAVQGFLVPARRLVTVDVTEVVPVRHRVSTSIVARSGRLVVDRIQALTGADGTLTLDVTPAAPSPAGAWFFADGRVDATTFERIAVYNPGDTPALVEVAVERPRVAQQLAIEPFEVQVAPQSYAEVVLNDEGRIPQPLRHSTVVRSLNGVPVVAERVQLTGSVIASAARPDDGSTPSGGATPGGGATPAPTGPGGQAVAPLPPLPSGLTATLGSPVAAAEWVVPMAGRSDTAGTKVVVVNALADRPVRYTLTAWSRSAQVTASAPAVLEGRQQTELPIGLPAGAEPWLVLVQATGPVVVDLVQTFVPVPDTGVLPGVPRPGGVAVPGPFGEVTPPSTTVPAAAVTTTRPSTTLPSTTVAPTTTAGPTVTSTVALATTTVPSSPGAAVTTTIPSAPPGPTTTAAAGG